MDETTALNMVEGPDSDQAPRLISTGEYVLGRNPGVFFQITDPAVSRRQALVVFDPDADRHIIIGLSSSVSTHVNGEPIPTDGYPLASQDLISFGKTVVEYQRPASEDAISMGRLIDTRQRIVPTRLPKPRPT